MDRVQQNTTATISVTFTVDGVATDPSPATCTISIARDDGTVIATGATTHGTAGVFRYLLTTTHTAQLDELTASWTSSLGTLTTKVQVVGGFLFPLADLRAKLTDVTAYPTADLLARRTWAEEQVEKACAVAFVPRYGKATVSGEGGYALELPDARIRNVRAVTVRDSAGGATVWTNDQIAALIVDSPFLIRRFDRWQTGAHNIDAIYEHGWSYPPSAIAKATLDLASYSLQSTNGGSSIDPRATSINTQDGSLQLSPTGGVQGGVILTGLPEVDAAIAAYTIGYGIY